MRLCRNRHIVGSGIMGLTFAYWAAVGAVFFAAVFTRGVAAAVVFSDNFSNGSTVPITTAPNNAYPATTATSTGYAIASSKNQSPAPSITPAHLVFGMASQSSAIEQAQALFSTSPITLNNTNDFIEFTITFVPAGILGSTTSSSGELDFGLFNSGHSAPHTDISASGLGSGTTDPTGGVQGWTGYTTRIFRRRNRQCRRRKFVTRPAQTGTDNSNQELLTSGASGSSSYHSADRNIDRNAFGGQPLPNRRPTIHRGFDDHADWLQHRVDR